MNLGGRKPSGFYNATDLKVDSVQYQMSRVPYYPVQLNAKIGQTRQIFYAPVSRGWANCQADGDLWTGNASEDDDTNARQPWGRRILKLEGWNCSSFRERQPAAILRNWSAKRSRRVSKKLVCRFSQKISTVIPLVT